MNKQLADTLATRTLRLSTGLVIGIYVVFVGALAKVEAIDAKEYTENIRPLLQQRCFACHGALKREANLRLDTAELIKRGGDSGAAIALGQPARASLIIERVTADDLDQRMPPEGEPLTKSQIDLLQKWIEAGAPAPAGEIAESDPREHWAFQPPVRRDIPKLAGTTLDNPIDAFLESNRRKIGVQAITPAPKDVLLRRLYIDLVGLPPSLEDLDKFLADVSPLAYESVVEHLLDSPQYGERWGRHWMDIWRYSDWWGLGAEVRNSQKHIWHYRDWIIESLNADKGYDQMLREMLAADELYPQDLDKLRATGYLARQYFKFNRTSWLDELIEHTSKSMLGMTFNCAKCHDHKYDPLEQQEYYQLRAIFEPYQLRTDMVAGETDFERDGIPRAFDCNLEVPTYLHVRGDDRNFDKTRTLAPAVPKFLAFEELKIRPITLPREAYEPNSRSFVIPNYIRAAEKALAEAEASLRKLHGAASTNAGDETQERASRLDSAQRAVAIATSRLASTRARAEAEQARGSQSSQAESLAKVAARVERETALKVAEDELISAQREFDKASDGKKTLAENRLKKAQEAVEAAKKSLESGDEKYSPLAGSLKTLESNLENEDSRRKPFPRTSTGRRSAFAKWLTDPRNPLVARVAVNHLWARHFGTPLVPTIFDFGRKGTATMHPELLDWLAVELVENGWSMKHIHRLIVTSSAYRASSSTLHAPEQNLRNDPENRYYWRTNARRMEAQVVRDGLLHLAGELDLTMGGPSIPAADVASRRRSMYFVHSHNEHNSFLSTYDDANVLECYRRAESIVPQQALALENSQLVTDMSAKVTARIDRLAQSQSDDIFVRLAFRTVLGVQPTEAEIQLAIDALASFAEASKQKNRPAHREFARQQIVRALFNHNDYITIR